MRGQIKKRHAMREFGTVYGATEAIRVNRLELRHQPLVPFPHRHAFYHVVLVTSGGGWHEIDFRRYEVRAGSLFFMKPGQVHSWALDRGTQGYVLEFEESSLPRRGARGDEDARLFHQVLESVADYYALSRPVTQRAIAVLQPMLEEFESHPQGFEVLLKQYLGVLLIEVSRLTTQSLRLKGEDAALDRFLLLLEETFTKEHEVDFYAKKLAVTAKALTMRCTRVFEKSARTLIHDRVVLEAKRLLAYSAFAIAEVGYELGFEDPNYFSRFFRKNVGVTPGEFRASVR